MAQKERKKAKKNIFLVHIQIPVKYFHCHYVGRAGIKWIISKNASNWTSGTSTGACGHRTRRRLPPTWMKTAAPSVRKSNFSPQIRQKHPLNVRLALKYPLLNKRCPADASRVRYEGAILVYARSPAGTNGPFSRGLARFDS